MNIPLHPPRTPTRPVGYAWLADRLGAPIFPGTPDARIDSVMSLCRLTDGVMLVPARMAPEPTILGHLLFALKHEGVNLHLLARAAPRVEPADLLAEFTATPNGAYIRKTCYLWERLTGRQLEVPADVTIGAAYAQMFDPAGHIVGDSRRNARWRVDFNGLGDLSYCPIVRRTATLGRLLDADILGQARNFVQQTSKGMLDRALAWAYLSETEGSYAIEREIPSHSKAAAFAKLLKRVDDPRELTQEYLVDLHNAVVNNPLAVASAFRTEQNRLQKGGIPGAAGVSYVPPAPELCAELMDALLHLANRPPAGLDPLILAGVVSFGFVFNHPFMDLNGRLSRFLIHHCLGQSRALPRGFVLPVSVAMNRHEDRYLAALQSFSLPARELCQVRWAGDDAYWYDWSAEADTAFRYPDLTSCVEFTLEMAQTALEHDLRRETAFLSDFDAIYSQIDDRWDIRNTDLSNLILFAFQNRGLSKHRRKQYADRVPAAALDEIEAAVLARLSASEGAEADPGEPGSMEPVRP
jgi:hypothetical protein